MIECSGDIYCKLLTNCNYLLGGKQTILLMTHLKKMNGEVIEGCCEVWIEHSWMICCKPPIEFNCLFDGKQCIFCMT